MPDFRDKSIMLVIGVSSTSAHDFKRLVGIGSKAHVLVGDVRLFGLPPLKKLVQNMSTGILFQ